MMTPLRLTLVTTLVVLVVGLVQAENKQFLSDDARDSLHDLVKDAVENITKRLDHLEKGLKTRGDIVDAAWFTPPTTVPPTTTTPNTTTDPVANIIRRLDRLEKGLETCGHTNFEKLLWALDEKFSTMTETFISNITELGIGSPYQPEEGDQAPGCMPPYEKKARIGCIYMSDNTATWRRAKSKCEDMGAQLIENPPLSSLLHYITKKGYGSTDFWVGGKFSDTWRWLDGQTITEGWNDGEPDYTTFTACVYFNWSGEGLLNDHLCTEKKKYICQIV